MGSRDSPAAHEDPTLEQLVKNRSPWEGLTLEKCVEECLPWEGPHAGAARSVRSPALRRKEQQRQGVMN